MVILDPVEAHLAHAQAVVTAQKLREIGMNVDLQAIDWGTQSARRQIKDPPDKNPGAWNIFHTWGGGLAMNSPLSNTPTPTPCDGKNWFGWPCDEELEKIRLEFPLAPPDKQKEIVERLQKRFYEVVPYIPAGQFLAPIALSQESLRRPGHAAPGAVEHREEVAGYGVERRARARRADPGRARSRRSVMHVFLIRRLLAAVPVIVVVTVFVFALLHLAPGDPAAIIAGDLATRRGCREDPRQARTRPAAADPVLHLGRASCCAAIWATRSSPRIRSRS